MDTKVCRVCNQELPKTREYFSIHIKPSGTVVFDYCCKHCAAAIKRQKRRENPEHEREIERQRHERDREKRNAAMRESHHKHRDDRNAKMRQTRIVKGEQYKAAKRMKHALNPEKNRQEQKRWREKNPDKCRVLDRNKCAKRRNIDGRHTLQDETNQLEKQGNRCYWCSKLLQSDAQVDHVVPLTRGGTNWPHNIVIACAFCNNSKNSRLPYIEWQPPNPLKLD